MISLTWVDWYDSPHEKKTQVSKHSGRLKFKVLITVDIFSEKSIFPILIVLNNFSDHNKTNLIAQLSH